LIEIKHRPFSKYSQINHQLSLYPYTEWEWLNYIHCVRMHVFNKAIRFIAFAFGSTNKNNQKRINCRTLHTAFAYDKSSVRHPISLKTILFGCAGV